MCASLFFFLQKYLKMQDNYFYMQDSYVNIHHNYVDMQEVCNLIRFIKKKLNIKYRQQMNSNMQETTYL